MTYIVNALSIDLEDWYQGLTSTSRKYREWDRFESRIERSTGRLLNILAEYNIRATFFVLGYVAEHYPNLIKEIHTAGHEIGLHSYHHQLVYELTPDQFRQDTRLALQFVEDIIGGKVGGYRAPAFSMNPGTFWALQILEELGFQYDSSVFPGKNMLYGWPGSPRFPYRIASLSHLIEIPVSTVCMFGRTIPMAGGFYMRTLPGAFTQWAIRRINTEGQPAILYLHPWEIDAYHPIPAEVTFRERISHYHNLQLTERKLKALLQEFKFCPIAQILSEMDTIEERDISP